MDTWWYHNQICVRAFMSFIKNTNRFYSHESLYTLWFNYDAVDTAVRVLIVQQHFFAESWETLSTKSINVYKCEYYKKKSFYCPPWVTSLNVINFTKKLNINKKISIAFHVDWLLHIPSGVYSKIKSLSSKIVDAF